MMTKYLEAVLETLTEDKENILFTGGLMQYAILTDDLAMVKLLQERGSSLKLYINKENHTWDYINSYTMLNYFESCIGKKKYSNFQDDEIDYYSNLFKENNKSKDEATKKLTLK